MFLELNFIHLLHSYRISIQRVKLNEHENLLSNPQAYTHPLMETHTHPNTPTGPMITDRHTPTDKHTHTHTHTFKLIQTETNFHSNTLTEKHTHTDTHTKNDGLIRPIIMLGALCGFSTRCDIIF